MTQLEKIWRRLRREPRPLRYLAARLLWASGLSGHFMIRRPGYVMRFYPTSMSARYWYDRNARQDDIDFLTQQLQPGDLAVDVGANIGALALAMAAQVGPQGRVVAIEAHPRIFDYLAANVKLNGFDHVACLNSAVGESPGVISFSDGYADDQNAVADDGPLQIQVRTLDELLLGETGRIAVLKVDVEGFEAAVFAGASATLARTECVYYESWSTHFGRYGLTSGHVIGMLRKHGFQVGSWGPNGFCSVLDDHDSTQCENLVAVRNPVVLRPKPLGA